MKNKILIAILAVVAVILGILAFSVLGKEGTNPDDSTYIVDNILKNTEKPETPIDNPSIREDLADEPILNTIENSENNEARKPTHTFTALDTMPEDREVYEYQSALLDPYMREYDYVSHYGFAWENTIWYHPEARSTMGFVNTLIFEYEEDPNELKEEAIYLVDSFRNEYSNVIYQNGETIKNMVDIPEDGLYILAESEEGWYSLRIVMHSYYPNTLHVYLCGMSKEKQLCRGVGYLFDDELERIEYAMDLLGREFDWNIIIKNGMMYTKDTSHDPPKDPEDYTPEDEMLLQILGIY